MPAKAPWSLTRAIKTAVPERRIYFRTENKTRYMLLRPATQVATAVALAIFLGWTGYATTTFVTRAMDGHSTRIQLETMREAYEAQLAAFSAQQRSLEEQLNQANQRRDLVTARLSDKQANLVATANRLQESEAELEVLRAEYETLLAARRDDNTRLETSNAELAELRVALADAQASNASLDGAFETLNGAMDRVIAERDHASSALFQRDAEVARLSSAMFRMEDRQERLIAQLEEAAQTSFAGLETIFGRAQIDLDRIMAQARRDYTGSGGPIEEDGELAETADETWAGDTRVAALMDDLETVNLMRFAADRLPLGEPVFGGRRTSHFGPRRRGHHNGLDIAAPRGTPIYSTADGIVTFAGRQRGYGIVVKIRHAFGFETVYAHLSRARVKVGQRVARGDRVADMGNTGRSTGTHLHYEIRINKEPVNPIKFIEAARDVL